MDMEKKKHLVNFASIFKVRTFYHLSLDNSRMLIIAFNTDYAYYDVGIIHWNKHQNPIMTKNLQQSLIDWRSIANIKFQ